MNTYFTAENTAGFSAADLAILNKIHEMAVARGWDAKAAADRLNNAWVDGIARLSQIETLRRAVNL